MSLSGSWVSNINGELVEIVLHSVKVNLSGVSQCKTSCHYSRVFWVVISILLGVSTVFLVPKSIIA